MTTTAPSQTAAEPSFQELARRVDEAAERVAELDAPARRTAEELKSAIEAVHRAGLVTIVRRMRADDRARELLFELVDEPEVRLLLTLHGITRADPMTEASRVLDTVRPGLQSHGGGVELVRIEDGVAYVRLQGACNGCSMASVTMRNGVEEALIENVPVITKVEVLPNEPSPTLIPLSAVRVGRDPREEGWVQTAKVEDVPDGEITPMRVVARDGGETEVIVINLDGRLNAYVNACAHQGMPLDTALLDTAAATITCPWHGFCYDAISGECMTAPGAQLEQLPLRIDEGHVWIRVGS